MRWVLQLYELQEYKLRFEGATVALGLHTNQGQRRAAGWAGKIGALRLAKMEAL